MYKYENKFFTYEGQWNAGKKHGEFYSQFAQLVEMKLCLVFGKLSLILRSWQAVDERWELL